VPIYLHPTIPHPDVLKAYFEGYGDLSMPAWGFAMDPCTHFLRLVFAGLFDAYPKLKMTQDHLELVTRLICSFLSATRKEQDNA
jgi:hypothetical protein